MKPQAPRIPQGVSMTETETVSLSHPTSQTDPLMYATPLKRRAREVLDGCRSENRLTLILSLVIVLGLGFAIPMILECLPVVAEILTALSEDRVVWPEILCYVLNGLSLVLLTLPLTAALGRMAVLMTEAHDREDENAASAVGLGELLYPFTSPSAYVRTLAVALRAAGCVLLTVAVPVAVLIAAGYWIPSVTQGLPQILYALLWVVNIAVACLGAFALLAWSCRLSGFAYFVFSEPDRSLREAHRAFKTCRRPISLPLWMVFSFFGWIILSIAAVFVPLILHTGPYMLLSWASYGKYLKDSCGEAIPADIALTETVPADDDAQDLAEQNEPERRLDA